ncbi:unnamed protein product, partial [Polarella glacialis]
DENLWHSAVWNPVVSHGTPQGKSPTASTRSTVHSLEEAFADVMTPTSFTPSSRRRVEAFADVMTPTATVVSASHRPWPSSEQFSVPGWVVATHFPAGLPAATPVPPASCRAKSEHGFRSFPSSGREASFSPALSIAVTPTGTPAMVGAVMTDEMARLRKYSEVIKDYLQLTSKDNMHWCSPSAWSAATTSANSASSTQRGATRSLSPEIMPAGRRQLIGGARQMTGPSPVGSLAGSGNAVGTPPTAAWAVPLRVPQQGGRGGAGSGPAPAQSNVAAAGRQAARLALEAALLELDAPAASPE